MPRPTHTIGGREFETLRRQALRLRGESHNLPSLWIACTDRSLDAPLQRVRQRMPALLLRRPGPAVLAETCETADELSPVNYAVERLRIEQIVVCGHSLCTSLHGENRQVDRFDVDVAGLSMVQRMRQREMLNQRARQHLVEQMRLLQTYPSVARAIERGELQLHALFYQVESGLFSFYEPASGEFSCVNAQPEVRPSRQFFADS